MLSPERMASEMVSSDPSLSSRCKVTEFINGSIEDGTGTDLNDILAARS
jgi:hypothetical protein